MKFDQEKGKVIKGREELQKGRMSHRLWFYFWLLETHISVGPRRDGITWHYCVAQLTQGIIGRAFMMS